MLPPTVRMMQRMRHRAIAIVCHVSKGGNTSAGPLSPKPSPVPVPMGVALVSIVILRPKLVKLTPKLRYHCNCSFAGHELKSVISP